MSDKLVPVSPTKTWLAGRGLGHIYTSMSKKGWTCGNVDFFRSLSDSDVTTMCNEIQGKPSDGARLRFAIITLKKSDITVDQPGSILQSATQSTSQSKKKVVSDSVSQAGKQGTSRSPKAQNTPCMLGHENIDIWKKQAGDAMKTYNVKHGVQEKMDIRILESQCWGYCDLCPISAKLKLGPGLSCSNAVSHYKNSTHRRYAILIVHLGFLYAHLINQF
jgi:hypothetical protein